MLSYQQIVRLFVFTLEKPPSVWFLYFKNQSIPPNISFFPLPGHSLNSTSRRTRDCFISIVSSVPGKAMEPRVMKTCSVYL